MLVEGCGRFDGDSNNDVALRGGAVRHGCVLDIHHFVLGGGCGGTAGGGCVRDLRIPAAAASTDSEDGARFLVGERAQESKLWRRAGQLGQLDVNPGQRAERQRGPRKQEDGQMAEGRGGWDGECNLCGRDDGGGRDQDGARGQQNAEEGGRRGGHFGREGLGFVSGYQMVVGELRARMTGTGMGIGVEHYCLMLCFGGGMRWKGWENRVVAPACDVITDFILAMS